MEERILIVGRLGKDPQLSYTKNQEPVCNFTVAEYVPNSKNPIWHKVVVWGKQAERCRVFLAKGDEVFLKGSTFKKEYKNQNGEPKIYQEFKADKVGFIDL